MVIDEPDQLLPVLPAEEMVSAAEMIGDVAVEEGFSHLCRAEVDMDEEGMSARCGGDGGMEGEGERFAVKDAVCGDPRPGCGGWRASAPGEAEGEGSVCS